MSITIRQEQDAGSNTAAISFTTSSQVGDTIILIQMNDWYSLANLQTPSGTAVGGGWTLEQSYDGGTNLFHVKVWQGTVSTANGTVVVNSATTDEERYAACYVLVGATYDTGGASVNSTASTSFVAPSESAAGSDDLMLCVWCNTDQNSIPTITPPGTMTAYTSRAVDFVTYRSASEQLTASGASGTRTATSSLSRASLGVTVLVKSSATTTTLTDPSTGAVRLAKTATTIANGKVFADSLVTAVRAAKITGETVVNGTELSAGKTGIAYLAKTTGETLTIGHVLADSPNAGVRLTSLGQTLTFGVIRVDTSGTVRAANVFGEYVSTSSPDAGFVCQDFAASTIVLTYDGASTVVTYGAAAEALSYGGTATICGR